jgi:putative endonuclease
MFTIYVLYSENFDKIYIGYTSDLENRIKSHNDLGTNGYTLKYRPWTLAYSEKAGTKTEALKRENQLKSSRGRAFIWTIIHEKYNRSDG